MKIFGKEYGMLYSVGAQEEIAELCPDGDLKRLGEYLKGTAVEANAKSARIPMILSTWYEKAEAMEAAAEGREYEQKPLGWETVELLDMGQFRSLMEEAFAAMGAGRARTVETETSEGQKKTEPAPEG